MRLDDSKVIGDWLEQFGLPDRYLAEHLLRRMRFVGFEEFEAWIQRSVNHLITQLSTGQRKEAIALFPVAKSSLNDHNRQKEAKPANDSAGRIAHALRNLERDLPKHVELTPRLESMRKRRVRHIVYVDDLIGTGNRFVTMWRNDVDRTVKAWCSRGWCKIWFLAFAGHKEGINRITNKVRPVILERIRVNLAIDRSFILESQSLSSLLVRHGARVGRKTGAFGYGDLATPLLFQHGCPNNASELLWVVPPRRRARQNEKWRPLFPNRRVPDDLYPLFRADLKLESTPEELWMARHYKAAVNLLDKLNDFRDNHNLLLVLGLVSNGKTIQYIKNVLVASEAEFTDTIQTLREGGLLDTDGRITGFGREVLARLAKSKRVRAKNDVEHKNFFPSTFRGVQREA